MKKLAAALVVSLIFAGAHALRSQPAAAQLPASTSTPITTPSGCPLNGSTAPFGSLWCNRMHQLDRCDNSGTWTNTRKPC